MKLINDILCEKLNPRSGVIKISSSNDEDRIYFDISWEGDFHFIVTGWVHYGWYYVQRDKNVYRHLMFIKEQMIECYL